MIEELTGAETVHRTGRSDRWLGLAVAAIAAVIGFGFAGRLWELPPTSVAAGAASSSPLTDTVVPRAATSPAKPDTPQSDAAITLLRPADGQTNEGRIIAVEGIAHESLRNVRLAVVLGEAVLGSLAIGDATAGPFRVGIPIAAPGFDVAVHLTMSADTVAGSTVRIVREFIAGAGRSVSLWRSIATPLSGGRVAIDVDGYAPSTIDALTFDVRTGSGRILASTTAPNAVADERPGSLGGRRLGLGTFECRIVLPGPIPTGGWRVGVSWQGTAGGSAGSVTRVMSAISP